MKDFLAAYSAAGVADFAKGVTAIPEADIPVRIGEIQSEKQGHNSFAQSYFHVNADGLKGRLDFGVTGIFNYPDQNFAFLGLSLDLDLDRIQIEALGACGVEVAVLKRGGFKTEVTVNRAILHMQRKDTTFTFPKSDCAMAALPTTERVKAKFLLSHFRDIAIGIMNQKRLQDIHHDGVKTFFTRVAMGEVSVAI